MRRARVHVSGLVQGVFFRQMLSEEAGRRGVSGWVRNLRDGRVEAVFEGAEADVERMIDRCRGGTPLSRVDGVEVVEEEPQGLDRFSIGRYA